MKPYLVIVNPAAGRGLVRERWPAVERALHAAGIEFEARETRAPLEAQSMAEQAPNAGYSAVIGVGGDGTLHEIANGLLNAADGGPTLPLGAIPLGTGDDFVKMIPPGASIGGRAASWQAAVERIASMRTRSFDVGRLVVDSGAPHYFINSLDVGFGAAAIRNLKSVPAALGGTAAYFASALITLWENPLLHLRVQMDEQPPFEGPVVIFVVMNGRCFGNGFWATPQAEADDGWLEILYGEMMGRLKILRLMLRMLRGAHLGQPGVHAGRLRKVQIESTQPLAVETDGELPYQAARRLEVEVLPGLLQVIV